MSAFSAVAAEGFAEVVAIMSRGLRIFPTSSPRSLTSGARLRPNTPSAPRDLTQASGSYAAETSAQAAGRLALASLACALVSIAAVVMMNIAPPTTAMDISVTNTVAAAVVGLSLVLFVVARRRLFPTRLMDMGLVYEVVIGLGISLAEVYATYDPQADVRGISWACLWIGLFPVVVPSTPGKTLLASFTTACMGPLALLIALADGAEPLSAPTFINLVSPNFVAAGLATLLSWTLHSLRMDVSRARKMGSYRLVERLGAGGMGEVWRAEHRMLARPAAIKLVTPDAIGSSGVDSETLRRRFEREALATAQLTSAHTVQIYDFGVTREGGLYYVMELLEGADLDTLVRERGPLPPARAIHILRQVAESLGEAHEHGLVHRDIKPANVQLCRLGTRHDCAKVLDFGLVALHGARAEDATRLTAAGTVTGTPAFMAPEVATGDHEIDFRVDIYALGCLAYWLLTAELVFTGETPLKVLYGHVNHLPDAPSKHAPHAIPEALDAIVLDCLAKDPANRPASALEVGRRLAAVDLPQWTQEQAAAEKFAATAKKSEVASIERDPTLAVS